MSLDTIRIFIVVYTVYICLLLHVLEYSPCCVVFVISVSIFSSSNRPSCLSVMQSLYVFTSYMFRPCDANFVSVCFEFWLSFRFSVVGTMEILLSWNVSKTHELTRIPQVLFLRPNTQASVLWRLLKEHNLFYSPMKHR